MRASLHLTIGVNVVTWRDAVREALDEAAREEVEFRRGVPSDGRSPEGAARGARGEAGAGGRLGRRRRSFVKTRRPIRDDAFDQLRALDDLDLDTLLERRRTVIADLSVGGRGARCRSRAASCPCPPFVRADLEFLLETDEPFAPATFPAGSTTRGASCSSAGSFARACSGSGRTDDEAGRPLRRLRVAREQRQVARLPLDVHLVRLAAEREGDVDDVLASLDVREREVVDSGQVVLLAEPALGRLDGKRVDRPAPVVVEEDPAPKCSSSTEPAASRSTRP